MQVIKILGLKAVSLCCRPVEGPLLPVREYIRPNDKTWCVICGIALPLFQNCISESQPFVYFEDAVLWNKTIV